jgi:hypothetical protein
MSTPWTRKAGAGGSLPSDRLRAPRSSTPPTRGKGKAGSGRGTPEPPRSERVRELEGLLAGTRSADAGQKPDIHGGCFCLGAR